MKLRISTVEMGNDRESIQGMASVTFADMIKVTGIRILSGKENKLFIAMPSYMTKEGEYKDICNPIDADFREELYHLILQAFVEEPGSSIVYNADAKEGLTATARVTPIDGEHGVKALGSIYLNDVFVLNNVTVRESREGKLFVAYPSYKTNERNIDGSIVYRNNYYPVTKRAQAAFQDKVLTEYHKKLVETQEEVQQDNPERSNTEISGEKKADEDPVNKPTENEKETPKKPKETSKKPKASKPVR